MYSDCHHLFLYEIVTDTTATSCIHLFIHCISEHLKRVIERPNKYTPLWQKQSNLLEEAEEYPCTALHMVSALRAAKCFMFVSVLRLYYLNSIVSIQSNHAVFNKYNTDRCNITHPCNCSEIYRLRAPPPL